MPVCHVVLVLSVIMSLQGIHFGTDPLLAHALNDQYQHYDFKLNQNNGRQNNVSKNEQNLSRYFR